MSSSSSSRTNTSSLQSDHLNGRRCFARKQTKSVPSFWIS